MHEYDDLIQKLKSQQRIGGKKQLANKDNTILRDRNMGLYTNTDRVIKAKVDELSEELAKKYTVQEEKLYEELYLKVRKMFLELM